MATVSSLPPELLLDILALAGGPDPSEESYERGYQRYLERNRNLKSFTLVHFTWRGPAQGILQEEVFIPGTVSGEASDEEVGRIAMLLLDSKLKGTKYLAVDGHLNELIENTGYAMWSQISLQELHLKRDDNGEVNFLCFDPSDVNLRFPYLRRITFGWGITIGVLSQSGETHRAEDQDLAGLLPITHKLFSPSNMPNLLHLALYASSNTLPTYLILLAKVLPRITTLAIWCDDFDIANLFPENRILDNLRHLSLDTGRNDISSLLNHGRWDLESLHLSAWSLEGDQEVISRLIKITKGEDSRHRIRRIVIYGKRKEIEAIYKDLVDDLDSFEWREDSEYPPFEDFDGR